MSATDLARNIGLQAIADATAFVSLHDADPGLTGASEISGGDPAYQRVASPGFDAPDGNSIAFSEDCSPHNVGGGITVSHFGLFTSGGQFLGGGPVSSPREFITQGLFVVLAGDVWTILTPED